MKLMIPGPVEVSPEVLAALSWPVEAHYGPDWVEKYRKVITLLKQVFKTEHDVFLMAGSGSLAIDAAIGSGLKAGEKIIIGNNGFFGDRLVSIAEQNGFEIIQVTAENGKKIETRKILEALNDHPDAKAVAVVHGETSTTVLNPIDEIGLALKETGAIFIVDAVSTLGGVPYEVDKWGIDICASASQKCLGAVPGLAPISVSPKAWAMIDRFEDKTHGWFTNLQIWRKYATEWGDWHPTPITMSSPLVNALLASLTQLMEEGISQRMERYKALALQLREGLRELGMKPFTSDAEMNPVLTAAYTPNGIDSAEIIEFLKKEHGIHISSGLGDLKSKLVRIGHMSPVLTSDDIDRVLDAIKSYG